MLSCTGLVLLNGDTRPVQLNNMCIVYNYVDKYTEMISFEKIILGMRSTSEKNNNFNKRF